MVGQDRGAVVDVPNFHVGAVLRGRPLPRCARGANPRSHTAPSGRGFLYRHHPDTPPANRQAAGVVPRKSSRIVGGRASGKERERGHAERDGGRSQGRSPLPHDLQYGPRGCTGRPNGAVKTAQAARGPAFAHGSTPESRTGQRRAENVQLI